MRVHAPYAAVALAAMTLACNAPAALPGIPGAQEATATPVPATPTGTQVAAPLVGQYFCYGHEGGQLAAAALLSLRADGTAIDDPAPGVGGARRRGNWRYLGEEERIAFGGELSFADADVSLGSRRLTIELPADVDRPHAEQGVLQCEPQ